MGRRYDLEVYNPVGGNGVYHPGTPVFAGQHIFKANDDIVAALADRQTLVVSPTVRAQLPSLLAPQDPHYFSCNAAMVYQHDGEWVALCRTGGGRRRAMDTGLGSCPHRQYVG